MERPNEVRVPFMRLPDVPVSLEAAVQEFRDILILQALSRFNWNINRAAAHLRMNRTTLSMRLHREPKWQKYRADLKRRG